MKTAANVSIVEMADGRRVCFSYGVPVAAWIPTLRAYIKTDIRYSVTTSRHANQFTGADAVPVDDAELRKLILPLVGGTR